MIISENQKKVTDKIQHLLMIKTFNNKEIERKFPLPDKGFMLQATSNIIFYSETPAFFLRSGMRHSVCSVTFTQHHPGDPKQCNEVRKLINQSCRYLFAGNMTVCVENPRKSSKETMNK